MVQSTGILFQLKADRHEITAIKDQLTGNKEQGRSQKSKDGKVKVTGRTKGTFFYYFCFQH